jgi:predicted amidohydrolase
MKIYCLQCDLIWEDRPANLEKISRLIGSARPEAGALIVLPEMFATGYSMNVQVTCQQQAEDEIFLEQVARKYRVFVVGGVVTPGDLRAARNQVVAISPQGELLARYTKIHPFQLSGETQFYQPGSEIVLFDCNGLRAAPFICYDLRFPEVFRAATRRGASLLIVSALWQVKRQQHWLTLLQARAIENQAYVVGVNRIGAEPSYSYAGRSVVVDPHGVIIADAGESETVLSAELNADVVALWRKEFPALSDMTWKET